MKLCILGMVLVVTAVAHGQSAQDAAGSPLPVVLIKGHHIGESVLDYLNASALRSKPRECADVLTNPKTQKRYAKRSNAFDAHDEEFRAKVEDCVRLADALSGKAVKLLNGLDEFSFVTGCLVELRVKSVIGFDDVMRDLAQKYGPPDSRADRQFQNGFGAVFVHPVALWTSRHDVEIVAAELPDAVEIPGTFRFYPVSIIIQDRTYADAREKKQQERPNSLD